MKIWFCSFFWNLHMSSSPSTIFPELAFHLDKNLNIFVLIYFGVFCSIPWSMSVYLEHSLGCACCANPLQSCLSLWTLWIGACQAPLSMGLTRQKYWSGLPCPSPGDLPNPGIEPVCLMAPALAGRFFTTSDLGSPILISVAKA